MSNDPAFGRYIAITAARFGGVAMVMLGIAIMQGAIGLPPYVGMIVAVLGMIEVFLVPRILAKKWKTPEE